MSDKNKKIFTTDNFKPGRIYTLVYVDSGVAMVGKRKFNGSSEFTPNPIASCKVDVRRVSRVQAAGEKTWGNIQRAKNPSWTPSMDAVQWWHVLPENSCIVEHNREATRYLRGIPKGIVKEEYTIDGQPATPEQIELVRKFKKNQGGDEFCLLTLEKLDNVLDVTGEDE